MFCWIWGKRVNILYVILKFACWRIPLGVISHFHLTFEALWFHARLNVQMFIHVKTAEKKKKFFNHKPIYPPVPFSLFTSSTPISVQMKTLLTYLRERTAVGELTHFSSQWRSSSSGKKLHVCNDFIRVNCFRFSFKIRFKNIWGNCTQKVNLTLWQTNH